MTDNILLELTRLERAAFENRAPRPSSNSANSSNRTRKLKMKKLLMAAAMLAVLPVTAYAQQTESQSDQSIELAMPSMCKINPAAVHFSPGFVQKMPQVAAAVIQKEQARVAANKPYCDEQRQRIIAARVAMQKAQEEQAKQAAEASAAEAERLAIEQQRLHKIAEEQQKAREAEQQKMAEAQKIAADKQRLAEIEASKPVNQLRLAYWRYLYVRGCNNARQGYDVVWINDVELEKARAAIKRIEKKLLDADPQLDTETQWNDVSKKLPEFVYENNCHQAYNTLMTSAPALPEVKDF